MKNLSQRSVNPKKGTYRGENRILLTLSLLKARFSVCRAVQELYEDE